MKKHFSKILVISTILIGAFSGYAHAAQNWDGQTGIFLNPLAYTAAPGSFETSSHYADLGTLGSVSTYSVTSGLKGNIELGYTRYQSNVDGVKNQNNISAKWQFAKETANSPALAVWAIHRDLSGDKNSFDYGLSATKIVTIANKPLVVDAGIRSTEAVGLGLFGIGDDRKIKTEASVAYFVTPKFAVGGEFKQQIGGRAWNDLAFRYVANDRLNIDAGLANFGPTLNNQIALAATYKL